MLPHTDSLLVRCLAVALCAALALSTALAVGVLIHADGASPASAILTAGAAFSEK